MEDIDYWADDMLNDTQWGYDSSRYGLSDEMIRNSVERACDFFHVEEPAMIGESYTTGVYVNDADRLDDDVLVFSRAQLAEMGITGQDAFDLVMTHEWTHRMLQPLPTGFDAHQEELCCDFMAGVRAGLNDMDLTQMENSLADTVASATHPAGDLRVQTIEQGEAFARDYMETYGEAPTFDECLEHFTENRPVTSAFGLEDEVTLRMEDSADQTGGLHPFADDSAYAPSFQGSRIKTVKLEQWGGGERSPKVDIYRSSGTSHTYDVKIGNEVVDQINSLASGTKVTVDGCDYKIP